MTYISQTDKIRKRAFRLKLFIKVIENAFINVNQKPCSAGKYQLKNIVKPTAFKNIIFPKFFPTSDSFYCASFCKSCNNSCCLPASNNLIILFSTILTAAASIAAVVNLFVFTASSTP